MSLNSFPLLFTSLSNNFSSTEEKNFSLVPRHQSFPRFRAKLIRLLLVFLVNSSLPLSVIISTSIKLNQCAPSLSDEWENICKWSEGFLCPPSPFPYSLGMLTKRDRFVDSQVGVESAKKREWNWIINLSAPQRDGKSFCMMLEHMYASITSPFCYAELEQRNWINQMGKLTQLFSYSLPSRSKVLLGEIMTCSCLPFKNPIGL